MRRRIRVAGGCMTLALALHVASAVAAPASESPPTSTSASALTSPSTTPAGDAKRGATVAATCKSCHGANGEGIPISGFPRLAGQTALYLDKQLSDYAAGSRRNAVMEPLAKSLNDRQRADVAAYYASLSSPRAAQSTPGDPKLAARGRLLSGTGDEVKHLQSCGNCHGPDGSGVAFAAPYLAGQSAKYLTDAIGAWKAGTRKNDDGMLMARVASFLDDGDIAAVSAYFSNLEPPKP